MRVLILVSSLLLISVQTVPAREMTLKDIGDAMLSLVHIVRSSDDKLERHEFREKTLGEQIKKSLSGLDKKHRSLDPLKGQISRLDERLSNVETILIQKEEREKQQIEKTNQMMESLKTTLQTWSDNISKMVHTEIKNIPVPILDNNATEKKLIELEEKIIKRIVTVKVLVDDVKQSVAGIQKSLSKKEECEKSNMDEKIFAKHVAETDKLLNKYETKLTEYDTNMTKIQMEIVPLGEISLADEAWHNKMTEALDKQHQSIQSIQKTLTNTEEAIKMIPTQNDINKSKNQTIEAINEIRYDIISSGEKGVAKLSSELTEMKMKANETQEDLMKSITEAGDMTGKLYLDIAKSYEKLFKEIKSLSKMESVMIQTGDNVMDIKRRIEYGIHQILLEVGEAIKSQSKEFNGTINGRFDGIEASLMNNETGSLANFSKKIEHDMSKVWRQIGIMNQQLMASNTALGKMQTEADKYVNDTMTTMDSMGGKVGKITANMLKVDENLNYLLGRLSSVTQEFNQIKTGLGKALDDIKTSFLHVQSKLKDVGPGPHYISSSELETK